MTASILKECHETFVSCFHAFYPTAFLKWTCLCDLLALMDKVSIIILKLLFLGILHVLAWTKNAIINGWSMFVYLAHFSWGYSICMARPGGHCSSSNMQPAWPGMTLFPLMHHWLQIMSVQQWSLLCGMKKTFGK